MRMQRNRNEKANIESLLFSWASIFGIPLYDFFCLIVQMALDFFIFDQKIQQKRESAWKKKKTHTTILLFFRVEMRLNIKDLFCRRFQARFRLLVYLCVGLKSAILARYASKAEPMIERHTPKHTHKHFFQHSRKCVCVFNWFFVGVFFLHPSLGFHRF